MNTRSRTLTTLASVLSLAGCLGELSLEGTGTAVAEIQSVPAGVGCLRVVFRAPAATADTIRSLSVTPGTPATLDLGFLAAGAYSFRPNAYSVACGSVVAATVPSWVGDPVAATIAPGILTTVPITLRPNVSTRTTVDFVQPVRAIYSGSHSGSTYAIMQDGSVRAWGLNHRSQLGENTTVNALTPRVVSGIVNPTQIAGGIEFACAATANNGLYCWGDNSGGQFADGTTEGSTTPRRNLHVEPERITVGDRRLCGLFGQNVMCWGEGVTPGNLLRDDAVEIKFGSHDNFLWMVTRAGEAIAISPAGPPESRQIVRARALEVTSSTNVNCILTTARTVVCWGTDSLGEVGDGPEVAVEPGERSTGLSEVSDLVSGVRHLCALRSNGSVWCWGANDLGQTGAGLDAARAEAPTAVPIANVTQIAAGAVHTCALLADGSVWCWGSNEFGQLGDGTTTNRFIPVRVRF